MKKISTSKLAKAKGTSTKDMLQDLQSRGLVILEGDAWELTLSGIQSGAEYVNSDRFGKYIVWPSDLDIADCTSHGRELVSSTQIGKNFGISPTKINHLLSEIGWIKKGIKGWIVTEQGVKQGGTQSEDPRSGVPYVKWPISITDSRILKDSVNHIKGSDTPEADDVSEVNKESDRPTFRDKFEAKHRTADGHFVRSKAEMLIDNWLYMAEIVHAYERKLPIEEDVYCDFYIPTGKVYIEYWGYENDQKYLDRKAVKKEIYQRYGFNLIELNDADVLNIDDVLPRLLLRYGIQSY